MLEDIPSRLLTEWIAYSNLEPFGEERADLRSALIACVVANVNVGKGQKPFKIDDFMLKFEEKKQMSDDEIKRALGF